MFLSALKLDLEALLEIDNTNVHIITENFGDQLRLKKRIREHKQVRVYFSFGFIVISVSF